MLIAGDYRTPAAQMGLESEEKMRKRVFIKVKEAMEAMRKYTDIVNPSMGADEVMHKLEDCYFSTLFDKYLPKED